MKTLPWADWGTGHEPPSFLNPALHPSHHLFITPLYHSSAGQGHTRWALIRADFTGQAEKCHLSCWTVALQQLRAVLDSPSAHKQWGKGEKEWWKDRAQNKKISKKQLKLDRTDQDLFHISSLVPRPNWLQCTATQSEDTYWIWASSLNQFPGPNELCWISLFPLMGFFFSSFLLICPCIFMIREDDADFSKIWINKHLDDKFNSSQFNPQPKTINCNDCSHQGSWAGATAPSVWEWIHSNNIRMVYGTLPGILMKTIAITNIFQAYELVWT